MKIAIQPPEQGQLVKVRGRAWIVSQVKRGAADGSPIHDPDADPQHLVTLASVEEDGLGEEIQVIWEIEPGAAAIENYGLPEPDGFDEPDRLEAFLNAVRWGAVSTADMKALQAPFRSGIEIEDYQLDPVARAIQMPRANLLVADDVGLGKTIESGLVVQEFITRHRARTALVVCPSSLQIQWREQMRDKFGLEFRIVDSALMKELRRRRGIHVNPWTHFPRLITSIDFVKRERPLRLFREVLPAPGEPAYPRRFDILIVDEAHNAAPSGRGRYATDSLRTLAIRTLVPHFEHKLFLSATPHNGYPESFTALLELLDNQRFARGVRPDRKQLETVMVRRLKTELPPKWDGSPRFPARDLQPIRVPYTAEERSIHAALQEYTDLRRKNAADQTEVFAAEFVMKLLKKRLFSSPEAFRCTLAKHQESLHSATRKRARAERPTLRLLRRQADELEEEFGDDLSYDDATAQAMEAGTRLFSEPSQRERELLKQMTDWADRHAGRPDSKTRELIEWLKREIRPDGAWSDTRVILFTEYRDTLNWLHQILSAEGFTRDERLLTLYGGMDDESRERIKAAFQADPASSSVRILLATDAASEGISLQNHCSRLIHFEIPWNPNRMEQRNGRVDRYGQKHSKVSIFHFVDESFQERRPHLDAAPGDLAGDLEFLFRAVLKLQEMERDLFGKVAPVVASQVEEAMLGRRGELDTGKAEQEADAVKRMLRLERDLKRRIGELHEKLRETKEELNLSPENTLQVVRVALELAQQPPLREATLKDVWPDPAGDRKTCPVFHIPPLRGSWALCTEGLPHPHTGAVRPITFDPAVAVGRDDVVLAHLNHRLVQMSLRLLRAEIWADSALRKLHRVAALTVPDGVLDAPAVIAHARMVLIGSDAQRLHEEVITAGGLLAEGRFRRLNVGEVEKALAAARPEPVAEPVRRRLAELWPKYEDPLRQTLEWRRDNLITSRTNDLQARARKESADAEAILTELRDAILAELKEPEVATQMALFSDDEREQAERNLDSLRARLEQIPGEIEHEKRSISQRYADPSPQLFPVALTYLVPRKLARKP